MPYSRFSDSLYKQCQDWAKRWKALAQERLVSTPEKGKGPKSLAPIIEIHYRTERKSAQRFSILLWAKGRGPHVDEYGHAEDLARAYEYGSGEHRKFGGAAKYQIRPKNKKYLVFEWEKANDSLPMIRTNEGEEDERKLVVLKKVEHPGVEAANQGKGYMGDARYKLLAEGKSELTNLGRRAILDDLNMAFKGGKKR